MTAFKEVVSAKRAHREKAIESAHAYVAKEHSQFLNATGALKTFACSFVMEAR